MYFRIFTLFGIYVNITMRLEKAYIFCTICICVYKIRHDRFWGFIRTLLWWICKIRIRWCIRIFLIFRKIGMVHMKCRDLRKKFGCFDGHQIASLRPLYLKAVISLYSTYDRYADDIQYKWWCLLAADNISWGNYMLAWNARNLNPVVAGKDWLEIWKKRLKINVTHGSSKYGWKIKIEMIIGSTVPYARIILAFNALHFDRGWMDCYTNPVFRMAEKLECEKRILIGPWSHDWPDTLPNNRISVIIFKMVGPAFKRSSNHKKWTFDENLGEGSNNSKCAFFNTLWRMGCRKVMAPITWWQILKILIIK